MNAIKPILFTTEMVRALLDGRKVVTRRVVKGYALQNLELDTDGSIIGVYDWDEGHVRPITDYAPYRPGDTLYVRETWAVSENLWNGMDTVIYRANYTDDGSAHIKWRPSIHMPKEAARLFLRVTDVRVERLQEITTQGIVDEGVVPKDTWNGPMRLRTRQEFYEAFEEIWDSTIKKADLTRYGWDANPWVWVIEFERCEKPKQGRPRQEGRSMNERWHQLQREQ